MGKRIVVATYGTWGDVYPLLAIAQGLQARGHDVLVASPEAYRRMVMEAGLAFEPFRSSWNLERAAFENQYPIRLDLFSEIGDSYQDLNRIAAGCDLLVTHSVVFAAPLIAAKTGLPLVSVVLQPLAFYSAYDPPLFTLVAGTSVSSLESRFWLNLWQALSWKDAAPVRELRKQLGLSPGAHPLCKDFAEAGLVLALFSPLLATPQPDWPPQTRFTGFVFYDDPIGDDALPPSLAQFLDSGSAPIVFTLGSYSSGEIGGFYEMGARAARLLGRRAVLVSERAETALSNQDSDTMVISYVPFQKLFSQAAAVVHHGGIGTAALALQAGRPALVIPHHYDQPETAACLARLGVARVLSRDRYTSLAVATELFHLLNNPYYNARASEVANVIRSENGVGTACDAIEQFLQG
jgi:rhamnosyltransferase subunit B